MSLFHDEKGVRQCLGKAHAKSLRMLSAEMVVSVRFVITRVLLLWPVQGSTRLMRRQKTQVFSPPDDISDHQQRIAANSHACICNRTKHDEPLFSRFFT